MNKKLIIIGILVFVAFVALGAGFTYFKDKGGLSLLPGAEESDIEPVAKNPKKGDVGYVEPNRTVSVDNETQIAGVISLYELDSQEIYVDVNGTPYNFSLTDEVAVQCTSQPELSNAAEADLTLVTETKLVPYEFLSKLVGAEAFVIADGGVEDKPRAHTIFVSETDCINVTP